MTRLGDPAQQVAVEADVAGVLPGEDQQDANRPGPGIEMAERA
jgi:hypothetical protein